MMLVLTELCQYLKNWFNRRPDGTYYPKYSGTFTVSGGIIQGLEGQLSEGQYFRIVGSLFNEGVHKLGDSADVLQDEVFGGAVWSLSIPPAVVELAEEIGAWRAKYETADSAAMSPFNSESFGSGGYSYSKSDGTSYYGSSGSPSGNGWQKAFSARLAPWRKI